jgi:large subunit ribosomal protein L10
MHMALSKEKKNQVVSEVSDLLSTSKMTVIAKYQGTTVKSMQDFRRQAKANGTTIRIAKNRLVKQAISQTKSLKDVDTGVLEGMLLYAFNPEDEVAPAQVIAAYSKNNPTFDFVGAISADGKLLTAVEVKSMATLPGKHQLIAEVIAMLTSPLNDTVNALSGNLHGLLDGLSAKIVN